MAAQSSVLAEYLTLLKAQNPSLAAARLQENERLLAVDLAQAGWQPIVNLRSDYLLSVGGRRIAFPAGDLLNPVYGTLNELTGQQAFPTSIENFDEQLTPNNFHDTRVEATLPLLQPLIKREKELRIAQVSEATAATRTLQLDLSLQLKQLYFAYLQSL
ncbi:MAG: TolC family protein, partial [Bacteroidota bacterium]